MSTVRRTTKAVKAADDLEVRRKQAKRAYELRQGGMSWWAIAEEMQISETLAMSRVDEAITEAAALVDEHTRRSLLAMEAGRLDALQAAYWGAAISGDVRSAELVLKISAQRSRLLGLENIPAASQSVHTVIVQGNSEEYISALQGSARRVIES